MTTLPTHNTHKMQPLDRTFFKSLQSYYYTACEECVLSNSGKKIKTKNIGCIFATAYNNTLNITLNITHTYK